MSRSSGKVASVSSGDRSRGGRLAATYPNNLFWRVAIDGFASLWEGIRWFWTAVVLFLLANFFVALLTTGLNEATDPRKWIVVLLARDHLVRAGGMLLLTAALAFCAYQAARIKAGEPDANLAAEYVLKRVQRLDTSDGSYVPLYKPVYLRREADEVAQKALRRAARRTTNSSSEEPIGICVFGRPTLGKTRMAWEAMRAVLPDWTFVRWPYKPDHPFDFAAQRGRRVVLWLDDLQKFAGSGEIAILSDLPHRFANAGARLVFIATCRDGDDETRVRKELNTLLRRLTEVRPASISPLQADQLAKKLRRRGFAAQRDQFDGTPGSLLLGVDGMRDTRYPDLPEPAKRVLWAMKLLRSVGIYDYAEALITGTVEDVFQMPQLPWRDARDALLNAGFVRLESMGAENEVALTPVADVYLENAVPDYPPRGAAIRDDWPKLEQSFIHRQRTDALFLLGCAFQFERLGNLRANHQHSATCFRALLECWTREQTPLRWAQAQFGLGYALSEEAELAERGTKWTLLEEAVAAYHAAGTVYTRDFDPGLFVALQIMLCGTLRDKAELVEGNVRSALLEQIIATYKAALECFTREANPKIWAEVQVKLGGTCAERAKRAEGEERLAFLKQSAAAYRAVISFFNRESKPESWIVAQGNLIATLIDLARFSERKARARLLEEATKACYAALRVLSRENNPHLWATTQTKLGDIFAEQARGLEGTEATLLLIQAAEAYHAALQVIARDYAADDWAIVQHNLGNVLGRQAKHTVGKEQVALFGRARQAYAAVLEVWKRDNAPGHWATVQYNLGLTLKDQSELAQGEERLALLGQAKEALLAALEVYKRKYTPVQWAQTQFGLADTYVALAATFLKGDKSERCYMLRAAYRCALCAQSVFTEDVDPSIHYQTTEIIKTTREALEAFGCDAAKRRGGSGLIR